MIRELLTAVAYSKAPRTTFTVLHPTKAVLFRTFTWDMRHAHAPRVSALGAAALALPIGIWLGRKRAQRQNGEAHRFETHHDGTRTGPMRADDRIEPMDQTVPNV